jgi:redox-sensitive bicupin YhaK (pirin superfamily)
MDARITRRAEYGPVRFLLYTGRPVREPVVAQGPFVMNTMGEVRQAYVDYRAGKFGPIPS